MSGDLSHPCSPRLLSRSRRGWDRCGVGKDRKRALSHDTGHPLFIWDIKLIFAVNTQALFLGCCFQLQQLCRSCQRPTAGARLHLGAGPVGMRPTRSCRECGAAGAGLGLGLLPLPCPACTHGWRNAFAPSLGSLRYRTSQSCCCPSRSPHETYAESNINTEVPLEMCFIKLTLLPANLQLILC